MATPTGEPLWTRAAGFGNYGGHVNKRNHLSQGAIDPETDVTAEQLKRLSADLAAVARVTPFGFFVVQCNDTSPAAPTVTQAHMATGVRLTSYEGDAAPTGFPTLARVSDGRFTITFSSSYSDEYSVSGAFIVQPGVANNISTGGGAASVTKNSSTQLEILARDSGGAADADALVSFTVFSGGS